MSCISRFDGHHKMAHKVLEFVPISGYVVEFPVNQNMELAADGVIVLNTFSELVFDDHPVVGSGVPTMPGICCPFFRV